jgi:hypothetical protein
MALELPNAKRQSIKLAEIWVRRSTTKSLLTIGL